MRNRAIVRTLVAAVFGLAAQGAAAQENFARLTFGQLNVDSGLADRSVASLYVQQSVSPATDLQFELATQSREEDASYLSAGAKTEVGNGVSLNFSIAGSDSDQGIYPERMIGAGVEYVAPAETGLVYRLETTYAEYGNDTESTALTGEVVKFFPAFEDGSYLVGQLGGTAVLTDPGGETGGEFKTALTYVMPSKWSVGLSASTGTIGYEAFTGAPVRNDFVALRPFATWQVSETTEVILNTEFVDTDAYDITGVSIGLKVGL